MDAKSKTTTKSFFVVVLGVIFEHFDMMLSILCIASLGGIFIGNTGEKTEHFFSYMGYAIAFFFKPLGALVFGRIGDLYGRKKALLYSLTLMSGATLCLSLAPGFSSIGGFSTLLFFILRSLQGMAVGGEYGSALTYVYELNSQYRSFLGASVISATHVGGVCASFLAQNFVEDIRGAFFIAGVLGLLLLLFRSFMEEGYIPKKVTPAVFESPFNQRKNFLKVGIAASFVVFIFYGSLFYIQERLFIDFNMPRVEVLKTSSLILGLWVLIPPVIGFFVDKLLIDYKKIMQIGSLGVFISSPLLGSGFLLKSISLIFVGQILMHLFLMCFAFATPRFFGDLFSQKNRNTSLSFSYAVGASFTAALAPLVCHGGIDFFNTQAALILPFMGVSLLSLSIFKEKIWKKMMFLSFTISK